MYSISFKNSGPNITIEQITGFEISNAIKLPLDYKGFLLNSNGGIPNKVYFTKDNADLVVNFFLSLGTKDYSLEEYFNDFKSIEKILPLELVPIGEDAFGNLICISVLEKNFGNIFFWNHETENSEIIAESITELLEHLKDDI